MVNIPHEVDDRRFIQLQAFAIAMLLAFTIVVCWRLLAGSIAPAQGFLWLGVCCLCPIVWYSYGYLQASDKILSNALLTSTIGWVFVAMGFWTHYNTLLNAGSDVAINEVSDPVITILIILGLFILVVGGLLSWQAVTKSQSLDATSTQ
jgi:hypothetical protein